MTQVLILSGDATIARMLHLMLRTSGFDVQSAHRDDEARDLLGRQRFDIVVLDFDVALTSADRLTQELRRRAPFIPIVAISSDAAVDRKRIGVDAFIPKPFHPETLVDAIHALAA